MSYHRIRLACLLLGLTVSGCAEQAVRDRASAEFSCPGDRLSVTQVHESTYEVQGCNTAATYTCVAGRNGYTCVHDHWGSGSNS